MSKLNQLVYASIANPNNPISAERAILSEAAAFNKTHDITGYLHKENGLFIQVLECLPSVMDDLMGRIADDDRHHSLVILQEKSIELRDFAEWSMVFNDNLDLSFALAFGHAPERPQDVDVHDAMNLFHACAEVRRGV